MADPKPVLDDLRAEGAELDTLVAGLDRDDWRRPTAAPGWSVAHQVAHLAWTDQQSLMAARDTDAFQRAVERAIASPDTFVDEAAEAGARLPVDGLLRGWRAGRAELLDVLATYPPGQRMPWYGPPMSPTSVATGRLMETWAHGEDIADTFGLRRPVTRRLRHVVHIGVRTRDFAYAAHGLTPPPQPFRVEITGPDGELWAHGPEEATQRVTGPAYDFCRLVTQRTHRADTDVRAEGDEAERWLGIAQSFAGPPGPGRAPSADAAGN
ncbi:TIGR03084 family protein [Streptomyces sp. AJS327]|uniref:TIGR03084 family metal-binding protein n=1 Tax=Streptomyces sp. AJS327 TaxID=2545265 RepID=UPI0015DE5E6D|nr:TIGR03084 family metal-binding protein [Streptomyces sp. AJS327]MBA0053213.1 TIGR03084 family protein [Streptomyces sp. AJS327]